MGMSRRIQLTNLTHNGCANLAPIILGDRAWQVIRESGVTFDDWDEFKVAVNARFGIDEFDMHDMLYATQPASGEQGWDFVCRMEDERALLGGNPRDMLHIVM